jgi:hypothetical protein
MIARLRAYYWYWRFRLWLRSWKPVVRSFLRDLLILAAFAGVFAGIYAVLELIVTGHVRLSQREEYNA